MRRSIRLYSTLGRGSRGAAGAAGADPHVLLRPDRLPRAHVGNARPFVIGMWLRSWLRERGYEVEARPQHHGRQRQDLRRRARARAPSSPSRRPQWYLEDTGDLGLGRPDDLPKATETVPEIVDLIEELVARGYAYAVEGDVYFRVASVPEYGRLSGQRPGPGRGAGAEPAQGGPARLRALEGEQAGRGHVVGLAVGARPARAGTSSARRWPRSCSGRCSRSTAAGSTSSSRTTRTSSRSRVRSATSSRGSGCTTGCSGSSARRCRSRSATSLTIREALDEWGRETLLLFFLTAHWRKPIDFSEETLRGARAGRDASATPSVDEAGRGAADEWDELAAALDDDFNTPEALAVFHGWRDAGRSTGCARARAVRARLARRAARRRRRRCVELARAAAARRAPRSDFAEADRLRDEIEAAGWEVRDVAGGFQLVREPMTRRAGLRPPRRARGAARARARCSSCCATERAVAAEGWLRERGLRVQRRARAGADRRSRGRATTRASSRCVEPYRYADAYELAAADEPLLACLDQVTDPRNLGAVDPQRRGSGRDGRRRPGAQLGAGHAGRLPRVGRRGGAPAGRRRAEPRALPERGQGRRRSGSTRPTAARDADVGGRPHRRARARLRRRGQGAAAARPPRPATAPSRSRCSAGSSR